MNKMIIIFGICLLMVGCAWTNQAVQDYKTGSTTPLVNGEVSPSAQAQVIQNTTSSLPIPFSGPIALGIGFLATIFFTWQRGVSIRKNGGAPVATAAQSSVSTNGIIQDIANIFTGMFTIANSTAPSTTGSVWQRIWKTALATIVAGATTAATIPSVGTFLTGHPIIDGIFVAVSSGLAGLEKALSSVPVAAAPTTTVVA